MEARWLVGPVHWARELYQRVFLNDIQRGLRVCEAGYCFIDHVLLGSSASIVEEFR